MQKISTTKATLTALAFSSVLAFSGVQAEAVHWDYNDATGTGPSYWGDLSEDYHMCKDGMEQSPIDISTTQSKKVGELKFNYSRTPLTVWNNGHTLQVNYADGNSMRIGRDTYKLLQFHFHTPSEHTVNGGHAAMEVHFVHVNTQGQLAVVGVMLDAGDKENRTLAKILEAAPAAGETNTVEGESISGLSLMPGRDNEAEKFFTYAGSLTTPNCSEGVRWFVLKKHIRVSHKQVEEFSHFVHGENARPVQPQNTRTVYSNRDD